MALPNLTGNYVSLTYDRLLTVDTSPLISGVVVSPGIVQDGLGVKLTKISLDHTADPGNGGIFIINTVNTGFGIMGMQLSEDDNGSDGINFWIPGSTNNLLWVGATGKVTMGYTSGLGIPNPVFESGYTLYVNGGVTASQVKASSYNDANPEDLYVGFFSAKPVSLGFNQAYGVRKNEQVVMSGTCYWIGSGPQNGSNHNITSTVINSEGNVAFTNTLPDPGGWGYACYSYVYITWQRIGGIVSGSFFVGDGDGEDSVGINGIGRGMLVFYPVVLLADDNVTQEMSPLGGYLSTGDMIIQGAGMAFCSYASNHFVEVKPTNPASFNNTFIVSHDNGTSVWNHGAHNQLRGTFQYTLY